MCSDVHAGDKHFIIFLHVAMTSSPTHPCSIVLFPGLGADHRLFAPQVESLGPITVIPWSEPRGRESLRGYAQRLAEQIPATRPLILGGASLGGMIAAELASRVRPDGLILIGTATHPSQIAASARALASASRLLPLAAIDRMRSMAPSAVRSLGPMTPEQRRQLLEMADACPASFLSWAARAIFNWEGVDETYRMHTRAAVRIHGAVDRIIPPPAEGVDILLPRVGHVPSFTAAEQVNEAITDLRRRVC